MSQLSKDIFVAIGVHLTVRQLRQIPLRTAITRFGTNEVDERVSLHVASSLVPSAVIWHSCAKRKDVVVVQPNRFINAPSALTDHDVNCNEE